MRKWYDYLNSTLDFLLLHLCVTSTANASTYTYFFFIYSVHVPLFAFTSTIYHTIALSPILCKFIQQQNTKQCSMFFNVQPAAHMNSVEVIAAAVVIIIILCYLVVFFWFKYINFNFTNTIFVGFVHICNGIFIFSSSFDVAACEKLSEN